MNAHTPGPWVVIEQSVLDKAHAKSALADLVENTRFRPVLAVVVGGNSGNCVATTGCGPTSISNARLIAAAPDLLAALDGCLHFDDAFIARGTLGDALREWRSAARSAIAKATRSDA